MNHFHLKFPSDDEKKIYLKNFEKSTRLFCARSASIFILFNVNKFLVHEKPYQYPHALAFVMSFFNVFFLTHGKVSTLVSAVKLLSHIYFLTVLFCCFFVITFFSVKHVIPPQIYLLIKSFTRILLLLLSHRLLSLLLYLGRCYAGI